MVPAIHDFGEAGVLRHLFHSYRILLQQAESPPRGEEFNAVLSEAAGEFHDAGFIRNAQQGAADGGESYFEQSEQLKTRLWFATDTEEGSAKALREQSPRRAITLAMRSP